MTNENYIKYLERVVLALLQDKDDFTLIDYEHANPDNSPGYFVPYNIKQFIKQHREERQMLIFDSFPDRQAAEDFATHLQNEEKLGSSIYDSQDESNKVDPFPFELKPPIVLVSRLGWTKDELRVQRSVLKFKGRFAGT